MAQLVERTLGKGEVGSSNLPISITSFLLPVFSFCLLHSTCLLYTSNWRTEPTNVEKLADDLWLGVKGQSTLEIAGSPGKLFR